MSGNNGVERLTMRRRYTDMKRLLPFLLLAGCNNHALKTVELDFVSTPSNTFDMDLDKRVDVLVVVDNSGSMAEEQAKLAANFGPFIDGLIAADVDYRIAVTTTDLGNPWCSNTAKDGGKFATVSCLDRSGLFVSINGTEDYFDLSCSSVCETHTDFLGLTSELWIDSSVPDPKEAFECLAPQGVRGCGFESTLESVHRFVNGEGEESEFFRPGALFAVVILSDEEDCSWQKSEIFAQDGNKVFWSDPSADFPTSAVCWNAGVACTQDYDFCYSQDFDVDSWPTTDPSETALFSLSRYEALLGSFDATFVSIIAGVQSDGSSIFSKNDPEFVGLFGVDPGCVNDTDPANIQTAVPPVRLRDMSDARFSICEDDFQPVVQGLVDAVLENIEPACFQECVLDQDPETEAVEPLCSIQEKVPGESRTSILPCDEGPTLPGNQDVCWYALSGDQMAEECVVEGQNIELRLLRREGVPVDPETSISVSCEVSPYPSLDC